MKQLNTVILLTVAIMLMGCFSNENSTLAKEENIRGIIAELQKSFPEDAPIFEVSLSSCEKLTDNFCDATITYKKGNNFYAITYYDGTWTDPRECTRTIPTAYIQRYQTIPAKQLTDFTFDNISEILGKVYDQLQKESHNAIDEFALVYVSQEVGLQGGLQLSLTLNITKKDDPTQRKYAYKRLNGVGKKRRCLVLVKKYYSVSVTVNEKGEIQKDVDFSKSNTYEETTL